ncbi:sigma-70 family RNA polymerase sigma factor [Lentibacillus saliphilus]|uniref:sigma-70 family RNA polymerase sigma factor n=1 Tax=Lentibacillus saliphilus TaxID=2737028 RepID=UPI001C30652C|nr:sigma-70 family RNA polymerase sigma factor [Lentibacillus saliphilus]
MDFDRLREKHEDALIELMNQYGDYLLRTAILLVKDYQTGEEVVQDTFVTAFEKIDQLQDEEKLKSWLTTIAVNGCRSRMRRWSWKNIRLHFDTSMELLEADESAVDPEEALLTKTADEKLSEAIQSLDYKYREIVVLFYFNELKISDIATYTHLKENTVKTRLKRGRNMLKDIIEKGEGYDDCGEESDKSATQ